MYQDQNKTATLHIRATEWASITDFHIYHFVIHWLIELISTAIILRSFSILWQNVWKLKEEMTLWFTLLTKAFPVLDNITE